MLRIPNPVSNVIRARDILRDVFYRSFEARQWPKNGLNHDEFSEIATSSGHLTSKGQIGQKALEMSFTEDRSLDSIFNQIKAITELFRILGWLMPVPGSRGRFLMTPLGLQVAAFRGEQFDEIKTADRSVSELDLFQWALLNVCFPHPHTDAGEGYFQRLFLFILKVAEAVGGYMTRDEMILTVLDTNNDRDPDAINLCVQNITDWRTGRSSFEQAINRFMAARPKASGGEKKFSSMGNFTRFILSAIRQAGWFEVKNFRELPPQVQKEYQTELGARQARYIAVDWITDSGRNTLNQAARMQDVRWNDIQDQDRVDLALLALWVMASRRGSVIDAQTAAELNRGAKLVSKPGDEPNVSEGALPELPLLFDPNQQMPSDILLLAKQMAEGGDGA